MGWAIRSLLLLLLRRFGVRKVKVSLKNFFYFFSAFSSWSVFCYFRCFALPPHVGHSHNNRVILGLTSFRRRRRRRRLEYTALGGNSIWLINRVYYWQHVFILLLSQEIVIIARLLTGSDSHRSPSTCGI